MPRGMGRGGRYGYRSPLLGPGLLDLLILIGILYFLFKLFIVALPYALGLAVLLIIRSFLRGGYRFCGPF